MKRFLTFLIFSFTLTSLYADRIWSAEMFDGKNIFDTKNYVGPTTINDAEIYQWQENPNVFLYAPQGVNYKLIVYNHPEVHEYIIFPQKRGSSKYVTIPAGLVILGVESDVNADVVTIPAEMDLDGTMRDVVFIDEKALAGVEKIHLAKSNRSGNDEQQLIFNNTGLNADFQIDRSVWFMSPLSSEKLKNVTFDKDLTIYPRGLYSDEDDELVIPSQFKKLPERCFALTEKPLYITLPETLESIGNGCFRGSAVTSLRLPFYLKEIGTYCIQSSAISEVYFPWQNNDQHMEIPDDVFDFNLNNSKGVSYFIPRNYDIKDKSIYGIDIRHRETNIKYCDYMYVWSGDSVKSVTVANGIFSVAPEIKANEFLVVTALSGVEDGPNIIWAEKQNTYHASHLQITASDSEPNVPKFVLPYDTYCDTLSFITDKTGYCAMKLPVAIASDADKWIGHRYNSDLGRFMPFDSLDAGDYILAMRATTGEQINYLTRFDKNSGPLISAASTKEPLVEICDAAKVFEDYSVGYPHPTPIVTPRFNESGEYDITSVGELYFFQLYAPYAKGKVTLKNDIFLPNDDIWTPIQSFNQIFDGKGHVISGMNVRPLAAGRNAGMFERLGKNGAVECLYLKGTVRGVGDESYNNVGGVVGYSEGLVLFCVIDMDVCINANAVATVMGKADSYEQTPRNNLILGRVVVKESKGYNGLIVGDVPGNKFGNQESEFVNILASNNASNTAYVQCGNEHESKYFTSLKNASPINGHIFFDRDYFIRSINSLTRSNVYDLTKEIHTGQLASNIIRFKLAQNVSKLMAPLDSIPFPSDGPLGKPYVMSTNKDRNQYLTYHNCADYVGSGKCPLCDKEIDPVSAIEISTAEDLRSFAQMVNDATSPQHWYARLTADIDLEDKDWTPIGNNTGLTYDSLRQSSFHHDVLAYRGIFDGQGHTIRGLKVNGTNNCGLFGVLHDNALVCNLVLHGSVVGDSCVGSVAGLMSRSEISSVISYVDVQGSYNTGGLVGAMTGNHAFLANSVWLGKVTDLGDDTQGRNVGRLVGQADVRSLGWDIQPIKLQNIYLPSSDKDELFNVGSSLVPNQSYVELDSVYFRNDSVNQALKGNFYKNLLSAQYLITSAERIPSLAKDSDYSDSDEPSDPIDYPDLPDDQDLPQDLEKVDDWYDIASATQLIKLAEFVNDNPNTPVQARLTRDINLSNVKNWTPIGINGFNGIFDGKNHSIRGINFSQDVSKYHFGLFGQLDNADIINLMVYGKGIQAINTAGVIAGSATNSSHITNCLVDCPITVNTNVYVGGIVGTLTKSSEVANCLVLSSVENTNKATNAGLIVGSGSTCIIRNSLAIDDSQKRLLVANKSNKKVQISDLDYADPDSLACGAVAVRLATKALPTDQSHWGQSFGTDLTPILGAKRVHQGKPGIDYDYCNIDTIYNIDKSDFQCNYVAHRLFLDNTTDQISVPDNIGSLKAVELYHKRSNVRGYNSICLPGALPAEAMPEDCKLGYLKDVSFEEDKCKISFGVTTNELYANQPGIFFFDNSKRDECQEIEILLNAYKHNQGTLYEMPLTETNPKDGFDNVELCGTYQKKLIGAGRYKLSEDGGELVKTLDNISHVYPYHWYLVITGTRATRAIFSVEPPTDEVPVPSEEIPTYFDIMGHRIDPATYKGVRVWRGGKSWINK